MQVICKLAKLFSVVLEILESVPPLTLELSTGSIVLSALPKLNMEKYMHIGF